MKRTINLSKDSCIFVPKGSTVEIHYEREQGLPKVYRFDEMDNYASRELNLFDVLKCNKIPYLDAVIKLYTNKPLSEKVEILNKLPWTIMGSNFFIQEFINAVNPDIPQEEG